MALGPVNVPGNETAELEDIRRLAETANETANSAKGTSTEAKSTADAALKAANGAVSTAGDAKDVANEAKELAQSGKGTAEEALETANAAKETADGMSGKVDEALQTSKNAQDSASSALEAVKKLTSTINAVPSQSGVLVYTGGVLTPTWNNYDPAQLDMTGATSGTDAKEYTVTFTPKSELQWADGTKTGKQVTWKITKATISPPTQSGSLTYTGSPQSPVWSGYDSGKMTIGGVTSGTNAGSYDATATPTANYQWSGGTSEARTVTWTIGKAAGSLTLNPTSLALNVSSLTKTITVNRAGDGAITVQSGSAAIAEAKLSGTTITVTGKSKGSTAITVKVAAGTNHTAPTNKTCSVEVTMPTSTLKDNSWETIGQVSAAGQGANYWSVGDTKAISINGTVAGYSFSSFSVDAFIIGFNHNSTKEGNNKIHWLIGKVGGKLVGLCDNNYSSEVTSSNGFHMNTSQSNSGGWSGSAMRKTVLGNSGTPTSPPSGSLLAALPSDLRKVMKSVTKYTDNTGGGSNTASYVTSTTDYLFLLAEYEVFGERHYANSAEQNSQAQYAYFKSGNSRVAYKHSSVSTAVWWWLRSPCYYYYYSFCYVYTDGICNTNYASWSAAVLAGFVT